MVTIREMNAFVFSPLSFLCVLKNKKKLLSYMNTWYITKIQSISSSPSYRPKLWNILSMQESFEITSTEGFRSTAHSKL